MTAFAHDIRYAFRQLLRTPAFTAAAIITLALGIGVNTAFFAIVNAVVFRPMRAVALEGVYRPSIDSGRRQLSVPHFRALQQNLPDEIAALDGVMMAAGDVVAHIPGRAERVQMLGVSGGHADVFRLQPQAGRFITHEEDVGGVSAVVISDRLWREWFAGDPDVVERAQIRINGQAHQVVGVAPPGYGGSMGFGIGTVDLWAPISAVRTDEWLRMFGSVDTSMRLKDGVTPEAAAPRVRAVLAGVDRDVRPMFAIRSTPLQLVSAVAEGPFHKVGIVVLWLSALVLVAACANLANMLFTRGVHRSAEMSVRQALGASSGRLFRMLLTEAAIVSVIATALGLVLALVATWQFNAAFPLFRDRVARLTIDLTPDYFVFLYAFGAGAAAAAIVGIVTAWRASRVPPVRGMAVGDAATSVTRASRRTRLGLVALQVGAAVVLLMTAGAFYQETRDVLSGTVRFDTRPVATARIDLARHGYTLPRAHAFFDRLLETSAKLPGVEQVALADGMPGGTYMGGMGVTFAAERPDLPFTRYIRTSNRRVDGTLISASEGFLRTLNLRVIRGRDLSAADRDGAPLAVVITETLAAAMWPGNDALGKRLMFGNDGHWRTVVGIAEDPARQKIAGPRERLFDPARMVLSPYEQRFPDEPADTSAAAQAKRAPQSAGLVRQRRPREMLIVIRSADARGQLDALRASVSALDPDVAVFDAATVDESILAAKAPVRAGRLLLGALGLAALSIATLGIYSVVSFLVARRTREFGIRMALGAQKRQVVKMVIDDAVHLLLVGLLAGVFFFTVGERVLQARRYGFIPNDVPTWAFVLIGMLTVGLVAAVIPARRAASIDPNVALRDL